MYSYAFMSRRLLGRLIGLGELNVAKVALKMEGEGLGVSTIHPIHSWITL